MNSDTTENIGVDAIAILGIRRRVMDPNLPQESVNLNGMVDWVTITKDETEIFQRQTLQFRNHKLAIRIVTFQYALGNFCW